MRLIPNLEGDLTWRDVPGLVILTFTGMWLFDTVKSLSVWRQLAGLPWWWQFAFRFGVATILSELYLIATHGKWVRHGDVPLGKFLLGVTKVSVIIGIPGAIVSFFPWWMFLSLFALAFIIVNICEWFQRRREHETPP